MNFIVNRMICVFTAVLIYQIFEYFMRVKFIRTVCVLAILQFIPTQSIQAFEQINPELWPGFRELSQEAQSVFSDQSGYETLLLRMLESAREHNSLTEIQAVFEIHTLTEQNWPITTFEIADFLQKFSSLKKTECRSSEFVHFLSEYYHFIYPLNDLDLERLTKACDARYANNLTNLEIEQRIQHLYKLLPLSKPFAQDARGAFDQYILTLFIKHLTEPDFLQTYDLSHPSQILRNIFELSESHPIAGYISIRQREIWGGHAEAKRYIIHAVQLARDYSDKNLQKELDAMLMSLRAALSKADEDFLLDYLPDRRRELKTFTKEFSTTFEQIFRGASFQQIILTKWLLWKLNHF